jgi:ubiquinone/menaquinone biosynthesis C-methylase UbiE
MATFAVIVLMNFIRKALFLLLLAAGAAPAHSQRSEKELRNCVFLYSKPALALRYLHAAFDSLHFTEGERIADIGSKGGNLAGILSLAYDRFSITLEDIDSSCHNRQQVEFVMQYYADLSGQPRKTGIQTQIVLGNDSTTTLPPASFSKVFFLNTFHELSRPRQMVAELYRITAPGGMLYVQETVSASKRLKRKDCGHVMPVDREVIEAFDAAGFRLVKTNVTERFRRKRDAIQVKYYHFRRDE